MRAEGQSFDRIAENYERRGELEGDLFGDWLQTALTASGGSALDIGCGAGRHAVVLAERFDHVDAIDLSGPMIELAQRKRARPNVTYRVSDLFDVTGEYDLVVSSAMLHHVPDLERALTHIASLVRPGGTALLADVTGIVSHFPRWLLRVEAVVRLGLDTVRRRPTARERYRLDTEPAWLDHMASDRFLTVSQFESRYGSVLRGATFPRAGFLAICRWKKP